MIHPIEARRQILIDVSELVQWDAKSGIQRVVRNIVNVLLKSPPADWRIEPVYDAGGHYAYARHFTAGLLGQPTEQLVEDPIIVVPGDIFLGLDLSPVRAPQNRHVFIDLINHDVQVYFVVYDLLPVLLREDAFHEGVRPNFIQWLNAVTTVSNGLVCISRSVADELVTWLHQNNSSRTAPIDIGYFHLGADFNINPGSDKRTLDLSADEQEIIETVHARPSMLMVGTLEPRKGHEQALSAFDLLWQENQDINLVIVGRQGWLVDDLAERMRAHPQHNTRLFWLENASDALLDAFYRNAAALLTASEGEGFGLPLIEAAQYGLPVIARDLPVFREVAGDHAYYFNGATADDLAVALRQWLTLHASSQAPSSTGMQWLTWAQSAQQLLKVILDKNWYRNLSFNQLSE